MSLELPYEEHCDQFIMNPKAPMTLRWWVFVNRLPAFDQHLCRENGVDPNLWAKYEGEWVKIVMASRFGDVGLSKDLDAVNGYFVRVPLKMLSGFTDKRPPK